MSLRNLKTDLRNIKSGLKSGKVFFYCQGFYQGFFCQGYSIPFTKTGKIAIINGPFVVIISEFYMIKIEKYCAF